MLPAAGRAQTPPKPRACGLDLVYQLYPMIMAAAVRQDSQLFSAATDTAGHLYRVDG